MYENADLLDEFDDTFSSSAEILDISDYASSEDEVITDESNITTVVASSVDYSAILTDISNYQKMTYLIILVFVFVWLFHSFRSSIMKGGF